MSKRFDDLESQLESLRAAAHGTDRRGFFKGIALGLMFALGLLFSIGVLYAQSGGDALFIDPRGWIGIGMNKPNAMLDVAGTLNVAKNTSLADDGYQGIANGSRQCRHRDDDHSLREIGSQWPNQRSNRLRHASGIHRCLLWS